MIPYGQQCIDAEDIAAVVEVLGSDWITQGSCVPQFEEFVASYVAATYGVAVNSGTSALHISCLALGLEPGDWLWTSPITFVASANCALYCGAKVDFVDIDPQTYNISIAALKEKLAVAELHGTLPKIVIPVHFAGQSCEMEEIYSLAKSYGFKIIEDASHAIGGKYKDKPIGCCKYSDITVFSFHPVKIITTGEGGLCVTNDAEYAENLKLLRSHGITRNATQMVNVDASPHYYEQISLGYNYRLSDIHAALGLSQLSKLDMFVEKRHHLAAVYDNELANLPLILPLQKQDMCSAWHLYVIQLDSNYNYSGGRDKLLSRLRDLGIGVNVHYIPVHTQPYFQRLGFQVGQYKNAEDYYKRAITIPLYPKLTAAQQGEVISSLKMELC